MTWFCFCFDFVPSLARCSCSSMVCLRFQVVQIKQVGCRMSTKNVNNYKQKKFCNIFGQLHAQEYNATKKKVVRLHLNEKDSKKSQTGLMSWYRKRKPTWRTDLITYHSHPWIMFSFNWFVIIWILGGGFVWDWISKFNGVENFGYNGQEGGGLENWTIFMDVICVSSL